MFGIFTLKGAALAMFLAASTHVRSTCGCAGAGTKMPVIYDS